MVYSRGEFTLHDLHSVVPHYLTVEHIETSYGILTEQKEVRYLGVLFDDTLSFTSHIKKITSKVSKVVGTLWKARSLPVDIKLKIYNSLVASHINFAILIWASLIAGNLTRGVTNLNHVPDKLTSLNTVHNNAVRAIVCARRRDDLSAIYVRLGLLKMVDMYYLNLATLAYSTFTEKVPDAFSDYLTIHSITPPHNTHSRLHSQNTNILYFLLIW